MSFHVPEAARLLTGPLRSTARDGHNGTFLVPSVEPGWSLWIIATDGTEPEVPEGLGWEHVSVHAYRGGATKADPIDRRRRGAAMRTPTWKEMSQAKAIFWDEDDVVMQLHPRRAVYVNHHPFTLHLWRPRHATIPEPPAILVGPSQDTP